MTKAPKPPAPFHPVDHQIRIIRGQKVMVDSDLASLYQVQTFRLNEAVKRNRARFPEDVMFQLTPQEAESLTSQTAIAKIGRGGRRTLPYAFTEHGVAMFSSILNSDRAIQVNIMIFRAFIQMRELVASNKDIAARLDKLERGHDRTASVIEILVDDIDRIAEELQRIQALPTSPKRKIGSDL